MVLAIILLIILSLFSVLRILIGPTLWDKLLGLNLFAAKLLMLIVMIASYRQTPILMDIALVYALLGFVGIIFISIYVQGKGRF